MASDSPADAPSRAGSRPSDLRWLCQRILHASALDPPGLRWRAWIGLAVVAVTAVIATLYAAATHLWDSPSCRETLLWCPEQCLARELRCSVLDQQRRIAVVRQHVFGHALESPTAPWFAVAREGLGQEAKLVAELESQARSLSIQSFKQSGGWLILMVVGMTALAFVAGSLAAHHGVAAIGPGRSLEASGKLYWFFALLVFGTQQIREVLTSVVTVEGKSWFGWSSFCVSPVAWGLMWPLSFGFAMTLAYPGVVLFCLGRRQYRPTADADARDGAWGSGRYVLFLQTWSHLVLFLVVLPLALWLRRTVPTGHLSAAYTVPGAVVVAVALVISGRLIRRAVEVRLDYQRAASAFEFEARAKLPGDPTKNFLGEHWWSLPATVAGMVAVQWAVIQWSGVLAVFGSQR